LNTLCSGFTSCSRSHLWPHHSCITFLVRSTVAPLLHQTIYSIGHPVSRITFAPFSPGITSLLRLIRRVPAQPVSTCGTSYIHLSHWYLLRSCCSTLGIPCAPVSPVLSSRTCGTIISCIQPFGPTSTCAHGCHQHHLFIRHQVSPVSPLVLLSQLPFAPSYSLVPAAPVITLAHSIYIIPLVPVAPASAICPSGPFISIYSIGSAAPVSTSGTVLPVFLFFTVSPLRINSILYRCSCWPVAPVLHQFVGLQHLFSPSSTSCSHKHHLFILPLVLRQFVGSCSNHVVPVHLCRLSLPVITNT